MEIITLVKEAPCTGCGKPILAGDQAKYYSQKKVYHHPSCPKLERKDHPAAGSPQTTVLLEQILNELGAIRTILIAIRDRSA